jgi:hypothetical protein
LKSKLTLAGLLLSSALANLSPVFAGDAIPASSMTPLQLIQSGRYVQAFPAIKRMQAASPGDPSLNYYLGMCAVSMHDPDLAEACFCRVVVGTPAESPFVPLAKQQLLMLPHKYAPQCALTHGFLYRWKTGQQLRIYLSDGRTVPGTGMRVLTEEEYAKTANMARNSMFNLPIARTYQPGDDRLEVTALQAWDWAVKEKLFSYQFVRDPKIADIIVLWIESNQGYTLYPFYPGQPVLVWAPIFPVDAEDDRTVHMKTISAHEFGHALGLTHATGKADLMLPLIDTESFVDRQTPDRFASENDKASLRALYSMPPKRYF